LKDIEHSFNSFFTVGFHEDLFAREIDGCTNTFEVVALFNFFLGLVQSIRSFLLVNFANNIE